MKKPTATYQIVHVSFSFMILNWKKYEEVENIVNCNFCKLSKFKFKIFFFSVNTASKGGDEEPQKVKAAVFSNIALCHLKLKNYYEVKKAVSNSNWHKFHW